MGFIERVVGKPWLFAAGLIVLCTVWPMACADRTSDQEALPESEAIEVRSYLDVDSAGWADKESDHAFVVEREGCRIQWNAVKLTLPGTARRLYVRRDCSLPFSGQVEIHRAILRAIFAQWPIEEFDHISWGSFGDSSDWSWCVPIAIASAESEDWRDYRENYPDSESKSPNGIFVKLAKETGSYQGLRDLMREFGADVELQSVEKVFALEAKDLPFHSELEGRGIPDGLKLIYDVGFSYFNILR